MGRFGMEFIGIVVIASIIVVGGITLVRWFTNRGSKSDPKDGQ